MEKQVLVFELGSSRPKPFDPSMEKHVAPFGASSEIQEKDPCLDASVKAS